MSNSQSLSPLMRNGWFPFTRHHRQCCMRALATFLWALTVAERASVWCVLRVHSRSNIIIYSVWSECVSLYKKLPNYFPRYLYFLYFSQQCVWVPVAPILTNTRSCDFLILAILISARVAHRMALICLSWWLLMLNIISGGYCSLMYLLWKGS